MRTAPDLHDRDAQRALRAHDWPSVQAHALRLLAEEPARGVEWLDRLADEARPSALGGDMYAQSVMGFIDLFHPATSGSLDGYQRALDWYLLAARHAGGEPMIEQVRHWYSQVRAKGLSLPSVDAFLADPEIRTRYRRYGGEEL